METTKTIAKINKVNILLIENGDRLVPIKPICEALGVAFEPQYKKIKSDEILSSTVTLKVTVGADGKDREMVCIPFMFVFGWLFSINPQNVNPDAKQAVLTYKLECYKALYRHFTEHTDFLEQKSKALQEKMEQLRSIRIKFHDAKEELKIAQEHLDAVKDLTFEQWKAMGMQLKFDF